MDSILLATDLDKTLIGDDEATDRLFEIVTTLKRTIDLKLVYITGRSAALVAQLQKEKSLLLPDALVTGVGTEIYLHGQRVDTWPSVAGWDLTQLKTVLAAFSNLTLQPNSEQSEYKLSYYLDSDTPAYEAIQKELAHFPVDVVYSMDTYLDILPKGINKGSALEFLATTWSIDQSRVYACGDSGNDIDMLAVCNAIVVGNAKSELRAWAQSRQSHVYKAKGNFANGIIEGLEHYGVVE